MMMSDAEFARWFGTDGLSPEAISGLPSALQNSEGHPAYRPAPDDGVTTDQQDAEPWLWDANDPKARGGFEAYDPTKD